MSWVFSFCVQMLWKVARKNLGLIGGHCLTRGNLGNGNSRKIYRKIQKICRSFICSCLSLTDYWHKPFYDVSRDILFFLRVTENVKFSNHALLFTIFATSFLQVKFIDAVKSIEKLDLRCFSWYKNHFLQTKHQP